MLVLSADLLEGGSDRHDVVLLSNLGCVVGAGTCSCPPPSSSLVRVDRRARPPLARCFSAGVRAEVYVISIT